MAVASQTVPAQLKGLRGLLVCGKMILGCLRPRIGDLERKVHRHVPWSKELEPIDQRQLAHVDRHLVVRNLDVVVWKPNQPELSMWIWITRSAIETFTVTRADVVQL